MQTDHRERKGGPWEREPQDHPNHQGGLRVPLLLPSCTKGGPVGLGVSQRPPEGASPGLVFHIGEGGKRE